ncbi:hypothetical protein EVAR_20851_1 [Eumeta japonica]|uniref:Uncharacterized protein n=1 Tax=Eumeta variegata TaxID=151549 RepID=A0A4C1UEJ2_EUMVA|nr:hypothetical protein EVAR_20851_1 [Eumeta japonica]
MDLALDVRIHTWILSRVSKATELIVLTNKVGSSSMMHPLLDHVSHSSGPIAERLREHATRADSSSSGFCSYISRYLIPGRLPAAAIVARDEQSITCSGP